MAAASAQAAASGSDSALQHSRDTPRTTPRSSNRARPTSSMRRLVSQITASAAPDPLIRARARKRAAMSPVPPAMSTSRMPGRGRMRSMSARFHSRCSPPLIRSFIRS